MELKKNRTFISFLFFIVLPGIYIKYFASKKGPEYEDLALDSYVLLKVALPLLILINQWENNRLILVVMVYLMLETVLYIPTLIFCIDLFSKPRSYKIDAFIVF
jgi:hypothetical protein